MPARFQDRRDAGQQLAGKLAHYRHRPGLQVLALPRGGVPVAYEVAKALRAPLDIFVVRKLGLPGHEEFAIGAIATGGVRVLDEDVIQQIGLSSAEVERVTANELRELERRERDYRGNRPPPEIAGRTVILIDDGLATGSTMRAAVAALKLEHAEKIIIAVPVAPPETCAAIGKDVDEIVCAVTPEPFLAVGLWYRDFSQTSDEEVRQLLATGAEVV